MYLTNYKSVVLPLTELIGGIENGGVPVYAHTRECRRGSWMVPFERALASSYRLSIHIIPLSALVCPKV